MKRVVVLLATGFEEIEAITLVDVLRRAEVEVAMIGVDGAEVTGAHGISIKCDCLISEVDINMIDMVILPGGWGGVRILAEDSRIKKLVQAMDSAGKHVAAICAAPYALDKMGVLKDQFTCYPSVEQEITHGSYTQTQNIVDSGNVYTSRGPATAMEFGLHLVTKLRGSESSNNVREALLVS